MVKDDVDGLPMLAVIGEELVEALTDKSFQSADFLGVTLSFQQRVARLRIVGVVSPKEYVPRFLLSFL